MKVLIYSNTLFTITTTDNDFRSLCEILPNINIDWEGRDNEIIEYTYLQQNQVYSFPPTNINYKDACGSLIQYKLLVNEEENGENDWISLNDPLSPEIVISTTINKEHTKLDLVLSAYFDDDDVINWEHSIKLYIYPDCRNVEFSTSKIANRNMNLVDEYR